MAIGDLEEALRPDWALTDDEADCLRARGQHFAAAFMLGRGVSPAMRFARGIEAHLAHCALHPYGGGPLYPAAGSIWQPPGPPQVLWHFYVDLGRDPAVADAHIVRASSPAERSAFEKAKRCCGGYPVGGGYTHSIPHYDRALVEGLAGFRERIAARLAEPADPQSADLYQALLVVVDAIDVFRRRAAGYLEGLRFEDPAREANRQRLAAAYRDGLPMRPARGMFEAMVSTTLLFALDGPDNLGRFDQCLWPYYRDDLAAGRIGRAEALDLVRALWKYVDDCSAWNVAIGGTTRDGREASNELTLLCIEAARGRRRPNLALRLRRDTPEEVWDAALDTIATGNGLPALYGEESYLRAIDLAHLGLSHQDRCDFAFGGCTELMVHGRSNVGSLEGDFSVIQVLERSLHRHLANCGTFDDLLEAFEGDLRRAIYAATETMSRNQETRARFVPALMRTLLIDDCIERGRSYSDGGARYNWSVVNVVGLSNAIDSLSAIRVAVFEDRRVTGAALLDAMKADFAGYEDLRGYLQRCPRFGNDDPAVNALARRLSGFVYCEFKRYAPWRGGRFLCSTLMFVTYGWFGQPVGATPDGRRAGTPVADSAGPVQGRDRRGPTAMLHSVASLQQEHAPGTLVVNLRVLRRLVDTSEGRAKLKSLVRAYFALGGLQLQVNVVDQEVLRDAIAHPERHADLVVRVGGYSEYFNNLPADLKVTLLERTEHG